MEQKHTERKGSIAEQVEALVTPVADELGLYIWDVEFAKRGPDNYLTVTIDSDEGIDIEDCERVHRAIDPILDEVDPIEGFYYLEVSSPGIERDLRTPEHILASLGMRAEAKLYTPIDGKKSIVGELVRFEDGKLTILTSEGELTLDKTAYSKLCTVFFDENN
jgi:ribosome maturation factor RimP